MFLKFFKISLCFFPFFFFKKRKRTFLIGVNVVFDVQIREKTGRILTQMMEKFSRMKSFVTLKLFVQILLFDFIDDARGCFDS